MSEAPDKTADAYGTDAREAAQAADYDAWTCPHFFGEEPRMAAGEIDSSDPFDGILPNSYHDHDEQ